MKRFSLSFLISVGVLWVSSVSASETATDSSKELLEQLSKLTTTKIKLVVELSKLEIGSIAMDWRIDPTDEDQVEKYILACLTGVYDDAAGKVIGRKLVEEGAITQEHYDKLRTNCVGEGGIGVKTWSMWSRIISETKDNGQSPLLLLR